LNNGLEQNWFHPMSRFISRYWNQLSTGALSFYNCARGIAVGREDIKMLTSDKSTQGSANRSVINDRDDPDATLAELRRDLASLVSDVKLVVEARAKAAKDAAELGLDATRSTIRTYPVSSMAIAALIGVAAAVVLTAGPRRPRSLATRIGDWSPGITRNDLHEIVSNLQRSASRITPGTPLMSAFERVVDTVSSLDTKATLTPALEKAGAWLNTLRGNITGK
jgi:ElaB/YqjD/DUF883 family membrane-anchored ribosome-binding protein